MIALGKFSFCHFFYQYCFPNWRYFVFQKFTAVKSLFVDLHCLIDIARKEFFSTLQFIEWKIKELN
jgi:hypothetical protein